MDIDDFRARTQQLTSYQELEGVQARSGGRFLLMSAVAGICLGLLIVIGYFLLEM